MNIQWLRILDLRFLHTSKQIYRKLKYTEKLFEKAQRFAFPEKWFCIRRANFAFLSLLPTFNRT